MSISVRELHRSDVTSFYKLCEKLQQEQAGVAFARIESEEQLTAWFEDTAIYLYGVFDNNKLMGVLKAEQGGAGKAHSCYLSAALSKEYRGRGLSKQLLQQGLTELASKGLIIARAKVYSTNQASIAMLLSLGFTWAGTIYKHQWDERRRQFIDDLIFHKELS